MIFTAALFLHQNRFSFLVVVLNDVLCLFRIMELDDTCDVRTFLNLQRNTRTFSLPASGDNVRLKMETSV